MSKIFPTLMLYKLWEDGKIGSLDDPLEKYVENFTIKNPLGKTRDSQLKYVTDGLIFLDSGEVQIRSSSVTLRRMASQLSGACRGGRFTYRNPKKSPNGDWKFVTEPKELFRIPFQSPASIDKRVR